MIISGKADSAIQDKGGRVKNGSGHGQNCDQKCKRVIHREQSLKNLELIKNRSAEVMKINTSADLFQFANKGENLWITCGKCFRLRMDQAFESLVSPSVREDTGRSLSRKGSSSDSRVSPSSRGRSDPLPGSASRISSAIVTDGKETFR